MPSLEGHLVFQSSSRCRETSWHIIQFAFDEIGTCKKEGVCWATERHALGRILQIVAKYGGALTILSSGTEVIYVSRGGPFERVPNHLGYRAQITRPINITQGSHLQVILPLVPFSQHEKEDWRRTILTSSLPSKFYADPVHVRGHLVPIYESLDAQEACVGTEDLLVFQTKCQGLAKKLIEERPPLEPIVLDFGQLKWTPAQFETLLHLLQNVLQHRPVLLVEIDPHLAEEVIEMERSSPTQLSPELADRTPSITGRVFGELSETGFLETYHRVHATVLGLDIHGTAYIFGLKQRWCEPLLLSLIDEPASFENLCKGQTQEKGRVLRAIFNNTNPLFYVDDKGFWRAVWDKRALAIETKRVMTRHFDVIAERCRAWRGRVNNVPKSGSALAIKSQKDTKPMAFNLPWQNEWRREFFESSRILSRQRYADEIAQRLIFRLEKGLQSMHCSLRDVNVLACVTAPSIFLATALHRWWPTESRPAIADLGPYVLLNPDGPLPAIARSSGIVVVQDIIDRGKVSRRLIDRLQRQNIKVLCVVSLARLVDRNDENKVGIDISEVQSVDNILPNIKNFFLVSLDRPKPCEPSSHNDPNAYWVEPRSLRPFRYSTLRRELKQKNTKRERLRPFFDPRQEGVVCAGHYVSGLEFTGH